MRSFLYHFVRIIPILALAAIYAALLYIIADKGKWVKVALVGAMGLASLVTLGHNPLADPSFYVIMLGFGLLILLSGIFSGYIKYCYRRYGNQRE